jgi:hypothetical protein
VWLLLRWTLTPIVVVVAAAGGVICATMPKKMKTNPIKQGCPINEVIRSHTSMSAKIPFVNWQQE